MEKSNQHFVNEKETDLLIKKIEIEWDFQSGQSHSDCQSFQLSSPKSTQEKKRRRKKKRKKAHFTRPIESDEVKRDFLSNFGLDFENQVDKDIFVQYGEFSDYISLFNQKFNRPEKKICKFSLERLSKSMKKRLVFGDRLEEAKESFRHENAASLEVTQSRDGLVQKETRMGIKSMNLDTEKHKVSAWKSLKKSVSVTPSNLKKIPPGLKKFIAEDADSPFQERSLNPYRVFISRPPEDRKSVTGSSKNLLPNLDKSRGVALNSDAEDLANILSRKKNSSKNLSKQFSITTSLNRNSFLTKEISTENSIKKMTSQSTMNQTRVTDKSSSHNLRSNNYSSFEKKESLEGEEEKFDIYDQKISKNQIDNIINKFIQTKKPSKKDRFSEVIKYRCSLNPENSIKRDLKENPSQEDLDSFQIKITSCGDSSSNFELKPKRSIFSQMNGASKQEFYSINEEDHIKEEEDEHSSQSASLRGSLQNRISKSSSNTNTNSFLNTTRDEKKFLDVENKLWMVEENVKLIKGKSLSKDPAPKNGFRAKSGKKLKLKKKKNGREYVPTKKKPSLLDIHKQTRPGPINQNQPPNPNHFGAPRQLVPPPNNHPQGSFGAPMMNYNSQPYLPMPPQYGHFPMNPVSMAPMQGFPQQPQMPVYPHGNVFMPQVYPNYPIQNMRSPGGYMPNGMYMQSPPVFYNMPNGFVPRPPVPNSTNSIPVQDSSFSSSNAEMKSQEINSFNKYAEGNWKSEEVHGETQVLQSGKRVRVHHQNKHFGRHLFSLDGHGSSRDHRQETLGRQESVFLIRGTGVHG